LHCGDCLDTLLRFFSFTWKNGASCEFGFLDSPEDRYNFLGRQFSLLCFDELAQLPPDSTDAQGQPVNGGYLFLLSRLRSPEGSGLRHEIRAATNPAGPGLSWIKARWQVGDDGLACECVDEATGFRRQFIPAKLSDNPYLFRTDYGQGLQTLAKSDYKSLALGRWDQYSGSVFGDQWDADKHVCDVFEIPDSWEIFRGADDGYARNAVCLWLAHDRSITDTIFVVRELCAKGMTPMTFASAVLSIDREFGPHRRISGVIDSAAFSDTGCGGFSRAEQMNQMGARWLPAEKGPGSRIAHKSLVHARLALRSDGEPGLKIFRTCTNLVKTLPALPYSTVNPEDVDTDADDDCYDALRYALSRRTVHSYRVRLPGL
jgi:hypothetical protein